MDLNARKTMLIMRRRALLADLASIGKALRPAGLQDAKAAQERVFHALGRVQQIEDGSQAEVIRLGYLGRDARAVVPELMVIAAERTTGCQAIPNSLRSRIPGDTGEARLSLRCPDG